MNGPRRGFPWRLVAGTLVFAAFHGLLVGATFFASIFRYGVNAWLGPENLGMIGSRTADLVLLLPIVILKSLEPVMGILIAVANSLIYGFVVASLIHLLARSQARKSIRKPMPSAKI